MRKNIYFRLLDATKSLDGPTTQDPREVFDGGDHDTVEVYYNVLKGGGTGATLHAQHAATQDDGAYLDLGGAANIDISTAGTKAHVTISNYLRYLRWAVDASTADAHVIVDIVAKAT